MEEDGVWPCKVDSLLESIETQTEDIDGNFSEEEDHVYYSEHDTDSELEAKASDHDTSDSEESDDEATEIFLGRDKVTQWKKKPPPEKIPHRMLACLPKLLGAAQDVSTPMEAFSLFFDDTVLQLIVDATNTYMDKLRPSYSRPRDVHPVDILELKALLGLLILSGSLKSAKLNYSDLFDSQGLVSNVFHLTMSYRRFFMLLRCLHFDDVNTRAALRNTDQLAPIRNLLNIIVPRFVEFYHPGAMVTIDEQLVGFRGHCRFRQYMPSKSNKYGIKVFAMADSRTYYIVNMEVYAGKQPDGPYKVSNSPKDVVERLVAPISGTSRNVTIDNWFNSILLCESMLANHNLTILGTLQKSKSEVPREFLPNRHREACDSMFGFRDRMTLVSYVPKKGRVVLLLSTMHHDASISEASGSMKKPQMIMDYNTFKGGVDTNDQLCQNYNVGKRTHRWPMALFFHLLNVVGINALVILNMKSTSPMVRREFLKTLGFSLVRCLQVRRCVNPHLPWALKKKLKTRFKIPEKLLVPVPPSKVRKRGRCHVCASGSVITSHRCDKCQRNVCGNHSLTVCQHCDSDSVCNIDSDSASSICSDSY